MSSRSLFRNSEDYTEDEIGVLKQLKEQYPRDSWVCIRRKFISESTRERSAHSLARQWRKTRKNYKSSLRNNDVGSAPGNDAPDDRTKSSFSVELFRKPTPNPLPRTNNSHQKELVTSLPTCRETLRVENFDRYLDFANLQL
ncbi:hypothetical protein BS50DRAFT_595025 [Corynespora cassiicola Philippines]|uniref:Myb-like domain-containing protein n=1 Tax=Corynespora cassiicola Philippines TaxID=1448308 RepID=A0A2T2N0L0_CORCC|nr:hypothetical protein BS50DRAFT_595025 [Corynespora cassiicola Philippines]